MKFTVLFAGAASLLGAISGCSMAEDFNGHAYGYLTNHLSAMSGWMIGASIGAIIGAIIDGIRARR